VLQLFRDIRYSIDPRYELELTVSRLAWVSDYVSPAEMRQAIAQAQSLLVKGSGTRRDSGPFPDAAKAAEARVPISQGISASHASPEAPMPASTPTPTPTPTPATAAPIVNSVSSDTPPESEDPDDPDARIQDPFAAFKKRLNGDRFGSVPSAPAMSSARDVVNNETSQEVSETPSAPETYPVPESHLERAAEREHEPVPVTAPPRASAEPPREAPPAAESTVPASAPSGAQIDAPAIPFSEFPEALVAALQSTKNMVAAGIAQAFDWSDAGSVVRFSVEKPFVHNLLEQERRAIADAASRILGRPCGIEIRMDESRVAAVTEASQAIPAEVETVRMMFRGTIV
jgi:DNA polymerase-3 subunit gamma/tau